MTEKSVMIVKSDDGKFYIEAWGTVEVVDKDGEVIPVDEFVKSIPQMMSLKPKLHFGHTDVEIGEIVDIWKDTYVDDSGNRIPGIKIKATLYDTYRFHDTIKKGIESGVYNMLSAKGFTYDNKFGVHDGKPAKIRKDVELISFALVSSGRNPHAYVVNVNGTPIMKGDISDENFRKKVIALLMDGIPYSKAISLASELMAAEEAYEGGDNTPFAGYKDFDDCVKKNANKSDPKAYCAEIMRRAEGDDVNKADEMDKAKYPWDQCIRDQLKRGYSEEQARKICGSIRAKSQGLGKSDGGESMENEEDKKEENMDKGAEGEENTLDERVSRIEKSLENLNTAIEKLSGVIEKAVIMPEDSKAKTDNPPALSPGKGGVDYIQKGELKELVKGLLSEEEILDKVLMEKGYVKVEKGADAPSNPIETLTPEKVLEMFQKGLREKLGTKDEDIPSAEEIAKESLATWG